MECHQTPSSPKRKRKQTKEIQWCHLLWVEGRGTGRVEVFVCVSLFRSTKFRDTEGEDGDKILSRDANSVVY